jgi:signal transduction histidine kinase
MKSAGQNLRDGVVQEAPKVSRYGELIVNESDRLSGLVGQVLSWAGMGSQATAARRERVSPAQIAREALEDQRPGLETADFGIVLEAPEDLPALWADPAALRQALGNLIANAIKYGKPAEGRPWLRLAAFLEKGGRRVVFTVADRGPGIAAEDLPHLFEPFYRGRRVVASNLAGAGLGLALVRRIAENHGGELAVSQAGGGATFSLVLPAAEQP